MSKFYKASKYIKMDIQLKQDELSIAENCNFMGYIYIYIYIRL